jgi:hypothetical protein
MGIADPLWCLQGLATWRWGYPERFAQQALGHNSKAVHHAYSKNAEVTVPSPDDWEKQGKKNPQGIVKPAALRRLQAGEGRESRSPAIAYSDAFTSHMLNVKT